MDCPSPLSRSPTISPRGGSLGMEEEEQLADRILDMVDCGKARTLSMESAVAILTPRGISLAQLHQIWPVADRGRRGFLSRQELAVAIRLVGWVQAGWEASEELVATVGPAPVLKGITDSTSRKLPTPALSPLEQRVSLITPKTRVVERAFEFNHNEVYKQAFLNEGPVNGLLDREDVLAIFISKFTIPFHVLAQVFELIDLSRREALDIQEFCLGMHILDAFDSNSPLILPRTIPTYIHDQLMHLHLLLAAANPATSHLPSSSSITVKHPIVRRPGTYNATEPRKGDLRGGAPPPTDSESLVLSSEIEADLDLVRNDLLLTGHISGGLMTKFRSLYCIQPIEMAQIWNSTPGYDAVPVSPETIEAAIQRIRSRLSGAAAFPALPQSPSLPPTPRFPPESNTTPAPDFIAHPLPQRVASPASSEYSSSTDTAASSVPEIKPFTILPIEEEEWPHTDSSTASSTRWSRRPPSSCSGSCSSTNTHSVAGRLRRPPKPNHPPISLRTPSDVPAGDQYFTAEIQSLREQLTEVQHRLAGTMSLDKQARLQQHYTDEINRLTDALAQKNALHEATQALLAESRAHALELEGEKDDLRAVSEAQNKEVADLRVRLEQAQLDFKELSSTTSAPTMRIMFLRASLRKSQAEVVRAKEEIGKLAALAASQTAELSELRATKQPEGPGTAPERSMAITEKVPLELGSLEMQVQGIRNLLEQFIGSLDVDDKPSASVTEKLAEERRHRAKEVTFASSATQPVVKTDLIVVNDEALAIPGGNNADSTSIPEPVVPELERSKSSQPWLSAAEEKEILRARFAESGRQQANHGIVTPPETPKTMHISTPQILAAPVLIPGASTSTVPSQETIPLKVSKKAYPTPSSSLSTLDLPSPSLSPPAYMADPALAKQDLTNSHRDASKTPRPTQSGSSNVNSIASSSKIRDGLSGASVPPVSGADLAHLRHNRDTARERALFEEAQQAVKVFQEANFCSSPTAGPNKNAPQEARAAQMAPVVQHQESSGSHGPTAIEVTPAPLLRGARPSRKSTFSKSNRLQEWYEQEIGRLMARCENAQKLAEKAQSEEEHQAKLACQYQDAVITAMDNANDLRDIVHMQRIKITELSNRLEGRSGLIVNNPDEWTGRLPVDSVLEGSNRSGMPPPYEQALEFSVETSSGFHGGYPAEKMSYR